MRVHFIVHLEHLSKMSVQFNMVSVGKFRLWNFWWNPKSDFIRVSPLGMQMNIQKKKRLFRNFSSRSYVRFAKSIKSKYIIDIYEGRCYRQIYVNQFTINLHQINKD